MIPLLLASFLPGFLRSPLRLRVFVFLSSFPSFAFVKLRSGFPLGARSRMSPPLNLNVFTSSDVDYHLLIGLSCS